MNTDKLRIAGPTAGVVFGVGLASIVMIPGLGGTSTTKAFTDFYGSDGRRGTATVLGFVLVVGCWLMVWAFGELRNRLGGSPRADLVSRLALLGAAAVVVGTAIDLGPAMVQTGSDNKGFVGIPIAHAFAQAGAGAVIFGPFSFAAAILLVGLEIRRRGGLPAWTGPTSIVFAVLLVGSFMLAPGVLLGVWAVLVGVAAWRPHDLPTPPSSRAAIGAPPAEARAGSAV